jgi:potassium efflux system protein
VIFGAQLLFTLFEWNMQTPIVRYVPLALDATLFMAGTTAIKVKTFGLAALVLFVVIWGAGWSKQVSYRWVYTGVSDQGIRNSLSTFTQYFVVVLGLVLTMKIIGLDLTALTVFAGAMGVGIGFGMQQIVVNFISGILLLVERPLATTDLVNVDKYEGEVTRIGIRSLTVKTFDNQEVIIPNSAVITKPFTNWTRGDDVMRTSLMVGLSYDDDPHQAVEIIAELLKDHLAVLETPAPKVLLWEYGDSALMIRVQFHSRIRGDVGKADLRSQLLFAIWDAFKIAGISIPYPQQDIHVRGYLPKPE